MKLKRFLRKIRFNLKRSFVSNGDGTATNICCCDKLKQDLVLFFCKEIRSLFVLIHFLI